MRVVVQRVKSSSVSIDGKVKSSIGPGLLVLVGIEEADDEEDIQWLAKKIVHIRIFNDVDGVMNLSVLDTDGDILVISQFTLQAKTKKGNRPSYIMAARAEISIPLYDSFVAELGKMLGKEIKTGKFGADMSVELINDGPVTIIMDSKNKDF